MRKGTNMLRIASVLQILFGVGYFFFARFLLGEGQLMGKMLMVDLRYNNFEIIDLR